MSQYDSYEPAALFDLVRNHEVNAIYFDPNLKAYYTPLVYSMLYRVKEVFDDLLDKADINLRPEMMKMHPLGYALEQSDGYYLRKLLITNKLNHQVKNQKNINYVEALMQVNNGHSGLMEKIIWKNITTYLKKIEKQGIDFPALVSDKGVLADKWVYYGLLEKITKTLPDNWLCDQLKRYNTSISGVKIVPVYYPLLSTFAHNPKCLSRMIYLVGHEKDENGNNLLHKLALKNDINLNNTLARVDEADWEKIITTCLKTGFDVKEKNKQGQTIHEGLMSWTFYRSKYSTQMYDELIEKLSPVAKQMNKRKI